MMYERPSSAQPMYRSKLANIFGQRLSEPGVPLSQNSAAGGFMQTQNGATHMSPRGAVGGLTLRPSAPVSPRSAVQRPTPRGGYSSLGSPRSPRALGAANAAARASTSQSSRADHAKREAEIRALVGQAHERIAGQQQRDKMKKLMQSIANDKEEVPVSDLLLSAELANVPLSEVQKELFFKTPYANRFASTWEPNTPRSNYGLECAPRSVKWRAFDEALKHSKLQSEEGVEKALQYYKAKEAKAIADAKKRDEEAKALAQQRAAATGEPVEATKGITDDQLQMVHKIVKQRLSTQFSEIRTAFRAFDKDHSGNISAKECTDALLSLNVGVPRKWIDHLVNVADYDRDGEINYAEFARILTADDITKMKKENTDAEDGPIDIDARAAQKDFYKPGLKRSEMRLAQTKVRDMLLDRGGFTKMFRIIDEDKSGHCSRAEVRQLIMNLNLESIVRPQVLEELINLMDVDGDDKIEYKEFARVCSAEDVFDMRAIQTKTEDTGPAKLTQRQQKLVQRRAMGLA